MVRIVEISKKWHGSASSKVTSPTAAAGAAATVASCPRGHFAAYTRDGSRFFVPIGCLTSDTFRELLNMAEEEFGKPGDRPIVLPCSVACLEQILADFRGTSKKHNGSGRAKIW
ncbi:hypothetical protein CFC21_022770 [Triticum aestivum]|uniref:Uncharacterized protein n=3 Tax=Triticum TaxID=4564 RepID=A0A9R1PJC8_TRITD|nr:auxin-responsive protein SAUR36-like [Triticum dicoccoides]XP_044319722.1 auxin-responsive protein SAUR36-like [Triticum aestivum]KAF7007881.1 hypothetical protein CFC21_022770 [Triticum aestivum]VAH44458.1 unnamed protein product [Triticum turgidum subsp. durum]